MKDPETTTPPEKEQLTRKQVVEAFKKFPQQDITNPDDLDDSDPKVQKANDLLEKWSQQHRNSTQHNFERSTIYFDAGFTDSEHIDEIINDWLVQDLQNAEEENNPELVQRIKEKIEEIGNK